MVGECSGASTISFVRVWVSIVRGETKGGELAWSALERRLTA